jgi:hypothetical protein
LKGAKESQFVLIVLLIVSLVYSGLLTFVVAADEEHSYIIFQDDFEDGDAEEWTIDVNLADAPESSWAVELDDGNHVLNMSGRSLGTLAGNIAWTDYTLELKVKTLTTVTDVCINFRIQDISYYSLQCGDHFALQKAKPVNSHYLNSTESYLNPNTWYTITIVCIENSIKIYVDGVLWLSYLDENDPFLYGGLQVAVGGYEGAPAAMLIDDVKVFTTYRLYVTNLINKAEIEINNEKIFGADTIGAEEKLLEAQEALDNGNLSGAESIAKEAIYLAQHAPVGPVSVNELLNYPDEYNNHTVEVSGTLKGIQYDQGLYRFAVDDGIAVISVTFDGTLEEIANEDDVKVVGTFVALTQSVSASKVEKLTSPQPSPTEPEPTEPEPTEPEPTPTEPEPTEPEPTPTEPEPTEPTSPTEPSEPEPTSSSTDITKRRMDCSHLIALWTYRGRWWMDIQKL